MTTETITITVPLPTDPISALDLLPAPIQGRLQGWGIKTVGDLLVNSGNELLDIPAFGAGALYAVVDVLAAYGLQLKDPIGPLPNRPVDVPKLVAEVQQLRAELAKVRAENWVVPKIPFERWSVGPRVREDGLIRREAGTERAEHTEAYAAKCLAAADQAKENTR